jgi:uncharacterized protein
MKRLLLSLLAAWALAAAPALADTPAGTTEIRVSGTGSVTLPPDVANVGASVETNAPNVGDAVAQNNAIYDRIVSAVEKTGVARSDVTLVSYNMNYNPKPHVLPPNPGGERYGYTVSRSFNVKVRQIGNAGRVADACTGSGATSINGVSFGLADTSAARTEATNKAVADARANADTLAAAARLHIVSIKSVELGGGGEVMPQPMFAMAKAAPTQFDQSNVNVTVTVSATFLAQP